MSEFILDNLTTLLVLLVIAVAAVYTLIKNSSNRRAAESGEDLERIRQTVEKYLPDGSGCQIAYAHYEEVESYGRSVKTTYFRYAVAFRSEEMLVFPLGVDKKTREIQLGQPFQLTADRLGKINVTASEKDGAVYQVDTHLFDKSGNSIVQFTVSAKNLRKTRFYPVNVLQPEICEAFYRFIIPLAQQVASENTALEAKLEQDAKETGGTWGIILSVVGAVAGFFVAPVGLVISAVGLVLAVCGKMKGARSSKGLIVSGIVTALLAAWTVFFFVYIV